MIPRLYEKAARAGGRIHDYLAWAGVKSPNHETDNWAGRVELARVACRVAHLPQHGFVELRHGVGVVRGDKADLVYLIDQVGEKVAGEHPVAGVAKDGLQCLPGV